MLAPSLAWAGPPRAKRGTKDIIDRLPLALVLDASWSFVGQIGTQLTNRAWDAPYPWGTIGQYSTRILYGTSWLAMVGLESLAVVYAAGTDLEWLGAASYRTDWVLPLDLPACPSPGAFGGCGVGVGGFGFVQISPARSHLWFEAGGGWIQQRVSNDELRTVAESSWVLTPASVVWEAKTDLEAPAALRVFAGPGVYFGMHNAHMHPTVRGSHVYTDRPITEMYPLDAGIGPGGRVEAQAIFARHLTIEGELVMAPFLFGGPSATVSPDVAPLDSRPEGHSVWRRLVTGIGWTDPKRVPFKATLAYFAAELSSRPVDRLGYRGVMLRFDVPLRLRSGD